MKQKCAFFDFDYTIAHGDSINKLLNYTLKKYPLSVFRFLPLIPYGIGYVLHICSMESMKSWIHFPLDLLTEEEIKDCYEKDIVPTYYPHMVEEMKKRREEGCLVFLVTASAEAYMRFNTLPCDELMGTKTKIKNGHYTSRIIGENCKGKAKVTRINQYMKEHDLEIDYDHSYGYSDSNSDLPMLELCRYRYRVDRKDGHLTDF
nr:HAD-IB family hydrolase [Catenibacterium mitsuokai]